MFSIMISIASAIMTGLTAQSPIVRGNIPIDVVLPIEEYTIDIIPFEYEFDGWLSRYDEGVMERVNVWHDDNGWPRNYPTPDERQKYDGYIAVAHCGMVGKDAIVTVNGDSYLFLVSDCINPIHISTIHLFYDNNIIGEVDWQSSLMFGGIGNGNSVYAYVTVIQ